MDGRRWILVLLTAIVFVQAGRAQSGVPASTPVSKVYSLKELGDDPRLCEWIAEAIPRVIRPGCWRDNNLSCYAPAMVMAIHQTPDVHAEVSEFLKNVRVALRRTNLIPASASITQVQHHPIGLSRSALQPYIVPSAEHAPKHLFHFLLRYEGDGIIGANGLGFAEVLKRAGPFLQYNQYSTDPTVRMEQLMIDSENLRQIHDEWRQFWKKDEPSHLTPYRIHGGVGPASSSI